MSRIRIAPKRVAILLLLTALAALFFFAPTSMAASNCATSGPSGGAYTVTVCFTAPSGGAPLTGNTTVTATVSVAGTNPGTQRLIFTLDGQYLITDFQSTYTFTLLTARYVDGAHTLQAQALMRDNFASTPAGINVKFSNDVTTPPVNNRSFTPASGTNPGAGQPLVVAAVGDGAGGETNETNVVNQIKGWNPNLFLYLGDVYEKGSPLEFFNWYNPSGFYGAFRAITNPTVGNHEYVNGAAPGYFDYWDNVPPYYSFNAGGWHFVSLNSNAELNQFNPGTPQYNWLQQDLAASAPACTIAYFHHPVYSVGPQGDTPSMDPIWSLLYTYGVDLVLTGHDHDYQRWVPLDGSGNPNPNGITEFVVGSGGHGIQNFVRTDSRLAKGVSSSGSFGALRLQLGSTSASYAFINTAGSILDSGTVSCQAAPAPTVTPTPSPTPASSTTFADVADAYVDSSNPTVNNGKLTTLRTDASPIINSYLRFNVQGTSGPVSRATLKIFANSSLSAGYQAHSVADNTWGETTINYNNAPALGSTINTSGAVAGGTWVSVDVTSFVTGNGTYSFGLNSTSSTALSLASREAGANAPLLLVETGAAGPTNTPTNTPLPTATNTPVSPTATNTPLPPTATNTPGNTPTNTVLAPTATNTPTNTPLAATPTNTPTRTPTFTPTNTPLAPTPTNTATRTRTATPTNTPAPPTATNTPSAGGTTTVNPVADSYVDSSNPSANFGTSTQIRVDGSPIVNSYLRFSVSGLSGTVKQVQLQIFANSSLSTGVTASRVADNTWGETTLTYSNAPAIGSAIGTSSAVTTGTWITIDVTAYVTGNGTYSVAITSANATALSMASREATNKPKLVITTQ